MSKKYVTLQGKINFWEKLFYYEKLIILLHYIFIVYLLLNTKNICLRAKLFGYSTQIVEKVALIYSNIYDCYLNIITQENTLISWEKRWLSSKY